MEEEFWLSWYEIEVDERENNFTSSDDFYFNISLALASNMRDLSIDANFICKCLMNISQRYILDVRIIY